MGEPEGHSATWGKAILVSWPRPGTMRPHPPAMFPGLGLVDRQGQGSVLPVAKSAWRGLSPHGSRARAPLPWQRPDPDLCPLNAASLR